MTRESNSPYLNRGDINYRDTALRRTFTGISICNHPPPTLATTQEQKRKKKKQQQYSALERGQPLANSDWCTPRGEGFRCSAHGSVTNRAFTLFTVEGARPIY
jgi:hypothetical protein